MSNNYSYTTNNYIINYDIRELLKYKRTKIENMLEHVACNFRAFLVLFQNSTNFLKNMDNFFNIFNK